MTQRVRCLAGTFGGVVEKCATLPSRRYRDRPKTGSALITDNGWGSIIESCPRTDRLASDRAERTETLQSRRNRWRRSVRHFCRRTRRQRVHAKSSTKLTPLRKRLIITLLSWRYGTDRTALYFRGLLICAQPRPDTSTSSYFSGAQLILIASVTAAYSSHDTQTNRTNPVGGQRLFLSNAWI